MLNSDLLLRYRDEFFPESADPKNYTRREGELVIRIYNIRRYVNKYAVGIDYVEPGRNIEDFVTKQLTFTSKEEVECFIDLFL